MRLKVAPDENPSTADYKNGAPPHDECDLVLEMVSI